MDDHILLRKALASLISSFEEYAVLFEVNNGLELKEKISAHIIPDVILLDVNMPEMDGYEATAWLHKNFPQIKILALSMFSDEKTIIRILRLGAKGYILKNTEPEELKAALDSVMNKNFYLSEYISGKILTGLHQSADLEVPPVALNDKERDFLRHICTELTYKEIAEKMFLSPNTIDSYRTALFEKLHVHTRVGLVLYAIRHKLVEV